MNKPINLEIKTTYGSGTPGIELRSNNSKPRCLYPELRFSEEFYKILKPELGDLNVGDEVIISEVTLKMSRKTEDKDGGTFCFDVLSFSGVEDAGVSDDDEVEEIDETVKMNKPVKNQYPSS